MRARWTLGVSVEGVDVGAVPPDPWAVVVRSRGMGRIRTGGGGAAVAERWTGAGSGPGRDGSAGADLTGIAADVVVGGAGVGAGAWSVLGRVMADGRSPSSEAPPPSRAVGGSEGSGAPIPPRTRAEVFRPGAGARCTEGEGSDGFDDG
ncbi:hypothetical protein [Streptomyces sp. ms115]|uniref:hypothetical protein n=1 Tax=Streptomyces sp. ms115 TaxID=1827928 RepID=UPI00117F5C87|nr:hypothetical protein [Streptomyces sp. ms115]